MDKVKKAKYDKQHYEANKESINQRRRKYYQIHIERERQQHKEYYRNNVIIHMLKAARNRAKKKNIEFNLLKEDIYLPDSCPILDTEFRVGTLYCYSLDRIDNHKGYIVDNIQVISKKANIMKSNATPEELIKFAKWILKSYKGLSDE